MKVFPWSCWDHILNTILDFSHSSQFATGDHLWFSYWRRLFSSPPQSSYRLPNYYQRRFITKPLASSSVPFHLANDDSFLYLDIIVISRGSYRIHPARSPTRPTSQSIPVHTLHSLPNLSLTLHSIIYYSETVALYVAKIEYIHSYRNIATSNWRDATIAKEFHPLSTRTSFIKFVWLFTQIHILLSSSMRRWRWWRLRRQLNDDELLISSATISRP